MKPSTRPIFVSGRLRRTSRLVAGGLVALPIVAALGGGGSAAPALAAAGAKTHMVPAVLAGLPRAKAHGAAPADKVLTIGVSLQRPNPAGEIKLYKELYNPSSRLYHHFLTPAQFNRRFGIKAAQSRAVERWLTAGGLRVDTTAGGDYFTAQGTVAQLDRLFDVQIRDYTLGKSHFIANDLPPSVPTRLPIDAVAGLDNVRQFSLGSLTGKPLSQALASSLDLPTTTPGTGALGTVTQTITGTLAAARASSEKTAAVPAKSGASGTEGVFTPQDLWGMYDDPGAAALTNADGTSTPSTLETTKTDLGQGQTIGIFGEGETSSVIAQLRLFESAMGFPKVPVQTIDTEGGPASAYGDNTGAIEWYLDSQSSTGMAPDVAKLDFYFAKTLYDADVFADFNDWANDPNGPREMNASFGECEENPTNPVTGPLAQTPYGTEFGDELEAIGDPMLRQATIEGRTLFTAAGDTGSGCPEVVVPVAGAGNGLAVQPVPMVNYPCTSTYAVCVSGTVLSASGTSYPQAAEKSSETSWTFGGGGSSYFIPEPSFQQGVANISHKCVSTPNGTPYSPSSAPICRGVPDVSDLSGNVTGDGYFIYIDGEPSSEGGTSLSSPLMMGQWARVQAAASASRQRAGGVGFADPLIYRQASDADACSSSDTAPCTAPTYSRDFNDVTQSEYGAGNGAYQPAPGWDYASGWGSLNVANFIQDVDGTTDATTRASVPERPAMPVTTASMTSPEGNATDPVDVSLGDRDSLDLTGATLTASATKGITATLSGPSLGALPPPDATDGASFFVTWLAGSTVYYARADESSTGSWTYTSGNTGTYGQSSTYGYNDTASSAATGSVDTDTGTITIHVPASELGSPAAGTLLAVPQAFDQLDAGTPVVFLGLTTDSSDALPSAEQSRGVAVRVGS